jgi:hypothetical protein
VVIVLCVVMSAHVLKKSVFTQHSPHETPLHETVLVDLVDVPSVSAPAHKDRRQLLRVMFVGDSITEGMAPSHSQASRPLVPKEGSCSYRFPLIKLLEQNMGVLIRPVGPFAGHVGSRATHEACEKQLSDFISDVSDRHASIWGITAHELIGPGDFQKKRSFARKYYFGKKSQQFRSMDSDLTVAMMHDQHGKLESAAFAERIEREHLRRWSYFLRPQLMTVHIGTNDLATGASAATMIFDRWPKTILALLLPDVVFDDTVASTSTPLPQVRCSPAAERRCIGITTILPRSTPSHQSLIDESNDWLSRIQLCKAAASGADESKNACADCVIKTAPGPLVAQSATNWLPSHVVAEAWCMPCVFILNISSPNRINDSLQFMYDGLHPNSAGEQRIAEIMAEELETSGALAYFASTD